MRRPGSNWTIRNCHRLLLIGLLCGILPLDSRAASATNQIVQTGPDTFRLGSIHLDRKHRTLRFPAEVRITNEVVEYALVTTDGKTHESLLTTEASPTELHVAVLLLGVKPSPDLGLTNSPIRLSAAATARIEVEWQLGGASHRIPLERWIELRSAEGKGSRRRLRIPGWSYTGSFLHEGLFVAQEEGSLIALIRDPVALINNPGVDRDDDDIHFPNWRRMPPRGTPVTVLCRF